MNVVDLLRQSRVKIPWKKYYTKEELKFKVEDISIYEMFKRSALSNFELIRQLIIMGECIVIKNF